MKPEQREKLKQSAMKVNPDDLGTSIQYRQFAAWATPSAILSLIAQVEAGNRKSLELQRVYDERGLQIGRLEVALDRLRAQVEALTVPQWISVEDRLPPEDQEVLVYCPNNGDPIIEMDMWGDLYECPVSFSTVTICTGQGWASNEFENISHWQSLPTAPTIPAIPGTKENEVNYVDNVHCPK